MQYIIIYIHIDTYRLPSWYKYTGVLAVLMWPFAARGGLGSESAPHSEPTRGESSCVTSIHAKAAPHHYGSIFVMGMSRSGSSLTTSIVAELLGGHQSAWRGSGPAYPTDSANMLGYFERKDAVEVH